MQTIFEYIKEFWLFWFPESVVGNSDIIDLLSIITTIGIVWFCLLRPLVRISKNLTDRR